VVTDAEIFGRYKIQRPRRLKSPHALAARSALDIDFSELEEGDLVVHLQHGIGKYLGLTGLYVSARLQVAKAGTVTLRLSGAAEAGWIDGKSVKAGPTMEANLDTGNHTIVFRLDPKKLPEALRLEASDGTFLTD